MENGISPEEFKELSNKIDRVLTYLEDDPSTGRKGIYHRIEVLDKKVVDLETINKITAAQKAVYVFVGGLIFSVSLWLYNHFFG